MLSGLRRRAQRVDADAVAAVVRHGRSDDLDAYFHHLFRDREGLLAEGEVERIGREVDQFVALVGEALLIVATRRCEQRGHRNEVS